ncbi:uncharacterized protein B0I36DRAFT_361718 [Microdochium trichocladiopsis]|uniref:Uncharacterized protein n=1 Tax=Microdochium trichocladiopsis TaxID=1682393 RepID=A0A9P8YAW1_9PEZI|nr:uncharacterized protein B0I36DRAFT_361718 [Microdochium trichocladiopsis]KAH7032984.1 hypothetical protein B0I36DRAFT_361718 [Microdochium trichocladiopsis]
MAFALGVIHPRPSSIRKPAYELESEYSGGSFLEQFDSSVDSEPVLGHGRGADIKLTLANTIIISMRPVWDPARSGSSVCLQSGRQFTSGLSVFDVKHIPFGCGVRPSFLEMVTQEMSGTTATSDCSSHNGTAHFGCAVKDGADVVGLLSGAGVAFNGTVALEWRQDSIKIWHFTSGNTPTDVFEDRPDPASESWGPATAHSPADICDPGNFFDNHTISISISVCDPKALAQYPQPGRSMTCSVDTTNTMEDAF